MSARSPLPYSHVNAECRCNDSESMQQEGLLSILTILTEAFDRYAHCQLHEQDASRSQVASVLLGFVELNNRRQAIHNAFGSFLCCNFMLMMPLQDHEAAVALLEALFEAVRELLGAEHGPGAAQVKGPEKHDLCRSCLSLCRLQSV